MSDTTDEDPIDSKDISNTNLDQEMRQSYLDYAMSVIVSRALPDARDGLKPVHRRILMQCMKMGMITISNIENLQELLVQLLVNTIPTVIKVSMMPL